MPLVKGGTTDGTSRRWRPRGMNVCAADAGVRGELNKDNLEILLTYVRAGAGAGYHTTSRCDHDVQEGTCIIKHNQRERRVKQGGPVSED